MCWPLGSSTTCVASATPSYTEGFNAGVAHQRLMDAGVPLEHIKVAVYDDRHTQMVQALLHENSGGDRPAKRSRQ